MSRWHEPGCRHPDIVVVSDIPCCNYCFALAPQEDVSPTPASSIPPLPQLSNRARMHLTWPSIVNYSRAKSATEESAHPSPAPLPHQETSPVEKTENRTGAPESQPEKAILPEITSDDEIRLLQLSPGQPDGHIHVNIEVAPLRSASIPVYDALSYTWADESRDTTRCTPIFIGPYWDIFYVTRNCENGLRSIRHQQLDRLIWVDAICIKQESADDKTHAAGLMREIYMNASRVVVYLGKASANSEEALSFLKTAVAGSSRSSHVSTINQQSNIAVQSLFQRPYFSRLWVIQEIVLARDLEIFCGQNSAFWHSSTSKLDLSHIPAPPWFVDRSSWFGFTGRDILHLLLNTSLYKCSDPRDKVFGVLGLIHEKGFKPDYRLPVENVYTGVTAYLLKNCLAFEVLALAGTGNKKLNLPSWVPDWSQQLVQQFPEVLYRPDEELDMRDVPLDLATPIFFDSITDSEPELQVNADTGSLQVRAVKLCHISGEIARVGDQTKIIMAKGRHGTVVVSLLDQMYGIGTDSLFLLNGWDHPVILRNHTDTDSYSLVSVCALSFGPPSSGTWLIPWYNTSMHPNAGEIRVSKLSPEENNLILAFYSELMELCRTPSSSTLDYTTSDASPLVTARVLDFGLLSLTELRGIESRLRNTWNQLEQRLGWMFLDHVAIWKLFWDLNNSSQENRSGEGEIQLEDSEAIGIEQYCGLTFKSIYRWDLCRFCWSFTRVFIPESAALGSTWTPVFFELKSQLAEIQRWAEVTEQLLKVFEYSQMVLGKSWDSFPGTQLPDKWLRSWDNFRDAVASNLIWRDSQPMGEDYL